MKYTILTRVFQTNPDKEYLHLVEKAVWNAGGGGVWTESDGNQKLNIGATDTSGLLRFATDSGHVFYVVMGVDVNVPWLHVVANLSYQDTATLYLPKYYETNGEYSAARKAHNHNSHAESNSGHIFTAKYRVATGNALELDIVIT